MYCEYNLKQYTSELMVLRCVSAIWIIYLLNAQLTMPQDNCVEAKFRINNGTVYKTLIVLYNKDYLT